MIDIEWMKNNLTHVSDTEVLKLIQALEEVKEIMEVLKKGSFGSYSEPKDWLEKYFEEPLGNNGEPIKNINPEICEE